MLELISTLNFVLQQTKIQKKSLNRPMFLFGKLDAIMSSAEHRGTTCHVCYLYLDRRIACRQTVTLSIVWLTLVWLSDYFCDFLFFYKKKSSSKIIPKNCLKNTPKKIKGNKYTKNTPKKTVYKNPKKKPSKRLHKKD